MSEGFMTKKSKAEELFGAAFSVPRDPRSQAYKDGVLAALRYRYEGLSVKAQNPYSIGTAECDAFFSGIDEGNRIFRDQEK